MTKNDWRGAVACLSVALLAACGGGGQDDAGGVGNGYFSITEVTPDHGSQSGGNVVIISGQGFTSLGAKGNSALLGDKLAVDLDVISDTQLEVVVPAFSQAGPVDLTVYNSNGAVTLSDAYSYNPQPTVDDVNPGQGAPGGGDEVTITGSGFANLEPGDNAVFFGSAEAEVLEVVSDSELRVSTPPGAPPQLQNVTVKNLNGEGSQERAFLYAASDNSLLAFSHGAERRSPPTAASPEAGSVLYIDLDTMVVEESIPPPQEDAPDGVSVVAFDGERTIFYKGVSQDLHSLDTETGERVRLGPIQGCAGRGTAQAMTFHLGTLFMYCRENPGLLQTSPFGTFDVEQMTFEPIGKPGGLFGTLVLVSDGTDLYLISNNSLFRIDPNTGQRLNTNDITMSISGIRGAAFLNGRLYVMSRAFGGDTGAGGARPAFLYEVNPDTGASTYLMQIGSDLHGLIPTP